MGLQSTTFYVMIAWLPSIATSQGVLGTRSPAGTCSTYQVVGILSGLAVPAVLHRAGPAAGRHRDLPRR